VQFVNEASANVGATITAHHLLYNRNHMLVGGIHFYCLPILKRNTHQEALLDAATSGSEVLPRHRLGAHAQHAKEAACGCAGCYTAYAAIELYAEAFEQRNALDKLEAFASLNGPLLWPAGEHRSHHPGPRRMDRPDQPAVRRADRYPAARR
jgi:dihydroorotase